MCGLGKNIFMVMAAFLVLFASWNVYADALPVEPDYTYACNGEFQAGLDYKGDPLVYPPGTLVTDNYNNTVDVSGNVIHADEHVPMPGISYKLIRCIEYQIDKVTWNYAAILNNTFTNIVTSVIVLYLVLFGIRIAMGSIEAPKGEVVIAVIQIMVIAYLVYEGGVQEYVTIFKQAQKDFAAMITNTVNVGAFQSVYPDGNFICDYSEIWLKLDCILSNILGASIVGEADGQSGFGTHGVLATSLKVSLTLLKTIAGIIFSGPQGIIFGIITFIIIVAMFLVIAQAMAIYITSLLAITLLAVVAPLFLPMILFEKTKTYFDNWLRELALNILQPLLVIGYIAFTLSVLGYMLDRDCSPPAEPNTVRCGLMNLYKDARKDPSVHENAEEIMTVNTRMSSYVDEELNDCNPRAKQENYDCGTAYTAHFLFSRDFTEDIEKKVVFLRELIMVMILLVAMAGIMQDILQSAANMVGLPLASPHQKFNFYGGAGRALSSRAAKLRKNGTKAVKAAMQGKG